MKTQNQEILNLHRDVDTFTRSYIECALWSSTDDNDSPLDSRFTWADLSNETLAGMVADCAKFQADNAADLQGESISHAGHDFWLTRNGHGAGFWDGDYDDEKGKRLTDASHAFGERNLYVGDDGKLYI